MTQSHCYANTSDECESWSAIFTGPNLKECHVLVDTNSDDTLFKIAGLNNGHPILEQPGTFESAVRSDGFDTRVAALEQLCESLTGETEPFYPWYATSIELWRLTEAASHRVQRIPD